jgi:hypothetical protein
MVHILFSFFLSQTIFYIRRGEFLPASWRRKILVVKAAHQESKAMMIKPK